MKPPQQASHNELEAFLLSRQNRAGQDSLDWDRRKREWIEAVEQLYRTIDQDLLAESIAKGLVTVERRDKEIREEYLGTYRIEELVLSISGETVRFSPKGRNIIGARGRVDLVGEVDSMTLVLEPSGQWEFVLSRTPRRVAPLTGETLASALRTVMR